MPTRKSAEQEYPEIIPDVLPELDGFVFSAQTANQSYDSLKTEIESLRDRITRIIERTDFGGGLVISSLLKLSNDPKEVKQLGKSLMGIAPLLDVHNRMEKRLEALNTICNDTSWFASASADFSSIVTNIESHDWK